MISAAVALSTLCSPASVISNRVVEQREAGSRAAAHHVGGGDLTTRPVAQDAPRPAAEPTDQLGRTRIVGGDHQQAAVERRVRGHAAHESLEGIGHCRRVGEVVGMIHLDVGDDGARGVVVEEVVAELVRLDQERRSPTRPDRCAPGADEGADLDRRVEPGDDEQVAEQRRGGRLAMRAGDAEADMPGRRLELTEQRLPGGDRKPTRFGGGELRVIGDGADRR